MSRAVRPSKKDVKQQKQAQKQQQPYSRRQAEQQLKNLQQEVNENQYQDPTLRKAMRWWQRIDEKYFTPISLEDVLNKRDICTSNQVLMIGDGDAVGAVGSYRDEMVDFGIRDGSRVRVLFRAKGGLQAIFAIYGVEPAIPNYHSQQPQNLDQQGIKITPKTPKSLMLPQPDPTPTLTPQQKQIRLQLQDLQQNETICQRLLKLEQIQQNPLYPHEIDKELAMWEWELQRVNRDNHINWNKLIRNVQRGKDLWHVGGLGEYDYKIRDIRDRLYWGTVLRSFQRGFKDKTKKMLETYRENQKNFNMKPPKGVVGGHNHQKKLFQTDCKICFCSDNSDSNQVLYCDNCNTSFHLICYGLTSIPPQDEYFCQRCTYIRKQQYIQGVKLKKPYCQICLRTNFPMKKLDDHFYHVTCLVLFNFVEFRENKMVLKGSLTHQNIVKMVIENQIAHQECNQCRKVGGGTELGMQIKCSYDGCQNYCHPICAYLNGYKFELKSTNNQTLQVKMFCNDHLGSRVEQVYLRRFLCNLNQTSSKSQKQIRALVQTQQQNLQSTKQSLIKTRKKYQNRILLMTKFIKNLLKSRMEKGEQQIETETKQIIRKIKNQTHFS